MSATYKKLKITHFKMFACNKNEASPLTSEAFYPFILLRLTFWPSEVFFCLTVVSRSVRFSKFQPVQTRWDSWSTWESEHSGWFKLRTSVMLSSSPPSFKTCKNSVVRIELVRFRFETVGLLLTPSPWKTCLQVLLQSTNISSTWFQIWYTG